MDPITAWALAIKAVAEALTEAMRGQPLELRAKSWARWDAHVERALAFFAPPAKAPDRRTRRATTKTP